MKKKLIIIFAVFTVIGVGIFYFLTTGNVGVKYNTVEVESGLVGKYVEDVGVISSKNIRKYYGNGVNKVEEMTLELGDYVEKGQLLVKYEDNLDLEIKKVEKQIEALEATYNDAVLGADAESVSSARIEISRIRSQLVMAKSTKDRTEVLYNSGSASLIELEQAVKNVEQLQSSLGIAQNTYNQVAKEISVNVRERYEAEIDVLLLTLEILEKNKENYMIFADVDGIVTELNTFEGDLPSPGAMIIEIQDPTEKVLLVDFMVEDAMNIKQGMNAEINDLNLNIVIEDLKVSQVYPKAFVTLSELSVEENRQTIEIELPKSAEALSYGVEVEAIVMIDEPRKALLIPKGAVIYKNSKQYVSVLENGETVEREIVIGIDIDDRVEVKEGLKEGDLVILNYQED